MMTHHLVSRLPGVFLGAAPVFGLPLLGFAVGSKYQLATEGRAARRTSILQVHDRGDTVIPWQGGRSGDGWLYESRDSQLGVWAALHACDATAAHAPTPHDGGPANLTCYEHPGCDVGRVRYCMYDGGHGELPGAERTMDLVLGFFASLEAAAPICSADSPASPSAPLRE